MATTLFPVEKNDEYHGLLPSIVTGHGCPAAFGANVGQRPLLAEIVEGGYAFISIPEKGDGDRREGEGNSMWWIGSNNNATRTSSAERHRYSRVNAHVSGVNSR